MTKEFAITFPGQGSQSVGMLAELAESEPLIRQTFEECTDALGIDLWSLCQRGPKAALDATENTQPAMLCAGVAVYRVLEPHLPGKALVMAGHSLGEYSALVAAGALRLADAVRLVSERGRLMQRAVPAGSGAMAAILGLDNDAVHAVCEDAALGQTVSAANFNAPGQVVVAGHADAVARAADLAKRAGARRAVLLDVSIPSHCALMASSADSLQGAIDDLDVAVPTVPVLHNASVRAETAADDIRHALVTQFCSPVRWTETVEAIAARGARVVVEAGPSKVLSGLIKRIDKSLVGVAVNDPASLTKALECINA